MGTLNTLMDKLYKMEDLKKDIHNLDNEIRLLEEKLTPEEVENMSYEKFKWLWDRVKYRIELPQESKFEKILERKREEKYPELKRAVYFSDINKLDISDKDKKRIDRALADNYRCVINGDRIRSGAIAGLKVEELETLRKIGVLEKSVSFYIDGEYCCTHSEDELRKYFRYWELKKKYLNSAIILNSDEMKEWGDLEWYGCIYIEDEEGNYTELLSKEDYDSYDEKEIIYEVNSEKMDTAWDRV
jgi:hypothetical protein|nr:MAG TPA: hypothetical protein [Caudoviricetes sp.]